MPRGIGYNYTQSPLIQSLHPPYWAELVMSASVTGVERAVTEVELPLAGPGPSSSVAELLPNQCEQSWRWAPWPTGLSSPMASRVELPHGWTGAELLHGRDPPHPTRAVMVEGSSMAGEVMLPMAGLLHLGPSSASTLDAAVGIGEFLDVYI